MGKEQGLRNEVRGKRASAKKVSGRRRQYPWVLSEFILVWIGVVWFWHFQRLDVFYRILSVLWCIHTV